MMKFRQMAKRRPGRAAAIAVAVCAFLAAGVWFFSSRERSDGLPPAESPADTGALRIALLPTAECLPFYVAELSGINDSLGLSLRIEDADAQFDADTALYGHSVHAACSDLVRVQYHQSRGQRATILMGLQGAWGLVGKPASRVRSVRDLKDQLLGMARFAASDLYALQALRSGGMDYDDVLRAQANDYRVRAEMAAQGQTEAALLPEPFLSYAAAQGAKVLWNVPKADAALGCLAAWPDVLTSRRREAQLALLVRGYDLASERLRKHGLQGCDTLLARRFSLPPDAVRKMASAGFTRAAMPPAAALSDSRTFLVGRGVALSGSLLMDDRFLKP